MGPRWGGQKTRMHRRCGSHMAAKPCVGKQPPPGATMMDLARHWRRGKARSCPHLARAGPAADGAPCLAEGPADPQSQAKAERRLLSSARGRLSEATGLHLGSLQAPSWAGHRRPVPARMAALAASGGAMCPRADGGGQDACWPSSGVPAAPSAWPAVPEVQLRPPHLAHPTACARPTGPRLAAHWGLTAHLGGVSTCARGTAAPELVAGQGPAPLPAACTVARREGQLQGERRFHDARGSPEVPPRAPRHAEA